MMQPKHVGFGLLAFVALLLANYQLRDDEHVYVITDRKSVSNGSYVADSVTTLSDIGYPVVIRKTETDPQFYVAAMVHKYDNDASFQLIKLGLLEGGITRIWRHILLSSDPNSQLVVDVGANLGYYSLYSAKMGFKVISFEPLEILRSYLQLAASLNGLEDSIDLHPTVVTAEAGTETITVSDNNGMIGRAGVSRTNTISGEKISVPSETLSDQVKQNVCLLKIDIEGHEAWAIKGAHGLFENFSVDNIIMEYFPSTKENRIEMYDYLSGLNYNFYLLPWSVAGDTQHQIVPNATTWDEIPELELLNRDSFINLQKHEKVGGNTNLWIKKK